MLEFLQELVRGPNLIATSLLGLILLYWAVVICGFLGLEAFDIDLDVDVDVDAEPGLDLGDVLRFFHLGEVPVMIFASFFALFFWVVTVISNHYLNSDFSMIVMLWYIVPCGTLALFATKFAVMPMVPLFQTGVDPSKSRDRLIGKQALVKTSVVNEKFGQVEIQQDGPPIILNARTENGQTFNKGDVVELVSHSKDTDLFIVKLAKWENA